MTAPTDTMSALEVFELMLAYAAHERIADKTGRTGWHPTESMRRRAEPGGYEILVAQRAVPPWLAEWCWPV